MSLKSCSHKSRFMFPLVQNTRALESFCSVHTRIHGTRQHLAEKYLHSDVIHVSVLPPAASCCILFLGTAPASARSSAEHPGHHPGTFVIIAEKLDRQAGSLAHRAAHSRRCHRRFCNINRCDNYTPTPSLTRSGLVLYYPI